MAKITLKLYLALTAKQTPPGSEDPPYETPTLWDEMQIFKMLFLKCHLTENQANDLASY